MKTMKAEDIPAEASAREFLQSLDLSRGEVVFEQNGKPYLIFVPARMLEQRRQAKEALFALIAQIRKQQPGLSSDDVLRELEELDHPERCLP